jgi:ABC-type transport system involved in cytochrome c biogenesis permease subunit
MPLGGAGQAVTSAVFLFGIVYYALEYKLEIKTFSVFILPIIIFLQLLAAFQLRLENELPVILQNLFFEIHVIFNLLAYSSFAISFISSLMYLLLFYEIQGERMGFFYSRLPSLKLVDTITNKANVVGFLALSIGMLLGIMMALKTWTAQWELDPKLISILMIWMIYALVIISRFKMGWEGKRTAWISFFGFGGILFSFLVITTFFSKFHSFR